MDDGDMQLAKAAAREDTKWPGRCSGSCCVGRIPLEDDDGDGPLFDTEEDEREAALMDW
jgi:hypothetical protein